MRMRFAVVPAHAFAEVGIWEYASLRESFIHFIIQWMNGNILILPWRPQKRGVVSQAKVGNMLMVFVYFSLMSHYVNTMAYYKGCGTKQ